MVPLVLKSVFDKQGSNGHIINSPDLESVIRSWLLSNEAVKWHKASVFSGTGSYLLFLLSGCLQMGANWCWEMQLCWQPNCQGAKSKGVSFVNYTQCYKEPRPFFSPSVFKCFGSDAKRKKKGKIKGTIYTQLSQWDEQTFVCVVISAEAGVHNTHNSSMQAGPYFNIPGSDKSVVNPVA